MATRKGRKTILALKVNQWLPEWNDIKWNSKERRAEPLHWFYQFSMPASELRALSGIYARTIKRSRATQDLGIQRRHDEERSKEINRFVRYGFPCSNLSETKRESGNYYDLRQPGWLPTAIVVNVLTPDTIRRGKKVAADDIIQIGENVDGVTTLHVPSVSKKWQPRSIPPVEVIDGQHRLWAFDEEVGEGDFDLPVIAFVGLDLSWQAYLFYIINIKPTKINASLAFDLYPLLRAEEWLTKFEGHAIYRETRAQELVDLLWSHPKSPWWHRINMLGERGHRKGLIVTQASWVRSLLASFVKSWEGRRVSIGGLFGSTFGDHESVLPWTRLQQATFLIVVGHRVQDAISRMDEPWMRALREQDPSPQDVDNKDLAFVGPNNLLNSDQGIRIFLQVTNDLCFVRADHLELHGWHGSEYGEGDDNDEIDASIASLRKQKKIYGYLGRIATAIASYDWRTSTAPGLSEEERILKATFRGSGGYRDLRRDVLRHISNCDGDVSKASTKIANILGY